MKANSFYNPQNQKKLGFALSPKTKYINKTISIEYITNDKYQNLSNKKLNCISPNFNNNYLIYESFNNKGYNGIIDPSLSENNNFLLINNSDINSYQNLKGNLIKQKKNPKSNNIFKNLDKENELLPINIENKKYFKPFNILHTSKTIFTKKNYSKWNNVAFKEIKYKNNFGVISYNHKYKDNLKFKNQQQLSNNSNSGRNLEKDSSLFNDNILTNHNSNISIGKNYKNSIDVNYYKQNASSTLYYINNIRNNNSNNMIDNINYRNNLIKSYTKNLNNYKTPDHFKTIDDNTKKRIFINKTKNISKTQNNDNNKNLNIIKNSSNKHNYNLNNNNILKHENKKIIKNLLEKDNDKNKKLNSNNKNSLIIIKNNENIIKNAKTTSQFDNIDSNDLAKINNNKNISYEKYINNINKIQSIWRGKYVRELMSYYNCLTKFKDLLDLIIMNHAKKDFFNYIKIINEKKQNLSELINKKNNIDKKINVEKFKKKLTKKEDNYTIQMKNNNYIMKKLSKTKRKKEEIEDKNNLKNNNEKRKNFCIDKYFFQIINNKKKINKFKYIIQEKNEKLNIININKDKNIILREQKNKKENQLDEKFNNNDAKFCYKEYINYFKSNLSIINNEQLNFESINIKNDKKDKNNVIKLHYQINNYNLSLINNSKYKKPIIKEICHNEDITLINNNKNNKSITGILDYDLLNKSNFNEFTSIASTREMKECKLNLMEENQINLNTEIKGKNNKIGCNPFKDYIIEKQNNNINIINIKKKNEFNKELLFEKNDIELNIINNFKIKNDKNINESDIEQIIEKRDIIDSIENIRNKKIEIFENEKFCLINQNNYIKNYLENRKKELMIIKNENILYLQKKKRNDEKLIVFNNDILNIKGQIKEKFNKDTQISNEFFKLEPDNHFELKFNGIINKNTFLENNINMNNNKENQNKKKEEIENIINIDNIKENKNKNNDNNKLISKYKYEFEIINKKPNEVSEINNNINNIKNLNYNKDNEIEKADTLEINPYEIKRTQNNNNNIFISNENKLNFLNNKESIYNDKAKKNMMKIILPIRIKTILREHIRKSIFKILIYNLRKILAITHLILIKNNFNYKLKKYAFKKMEDNIKIIKIQNYYIKEFEKNRMKKLLKNYAVYKWNKKLSELSILIINSKIVNKKNDK